MSSNNATHICSNFKYSSIIELQKYELYKMKFETFYENATSDDTKSFNALLTKMRENVLEEYRCKYNAEFYNYILTIYSPFISISTPETKLIKINNTIYTMSISVIIQFVVDNKTVTVNNESYVVYGDCFFECVDLIISLLQTHAEKIKSNK